jgi:hypothetical protein
MLLSTIQSAIIIQKAALHCKMHHNNAVESPDRHVEPYQVSRSQLRLHNCWEKRTLLSTNQSANITAALRTAVSKHACMIVGRRHCF